MVRECQNTDCLFIGVLADKLGRKPLLLFSGINKDNIAVLYLWFSWYKIIENKPFDQREKKKY